MTHADKTPPVRIWFFRSFLLSAVLHCNAASTKRRCGIFPVSRFIAARKKKIHNQPRHKSLRIKTAIVKTLRGSGARLQVICQRADFEGAERIRLGVRHKTMHRMVLSLIEKGVSR